MKFLLKVTSCIERYNYFADTSGFAWPSKLNSDIDYTSKQWLHRYFRGIQHNIFMLHVYCVCVVRSNHRRLDSLH